MERKRTFERIDNPRAQNKFSETGHHGYGDLKAVGKIIQQGKRIALTEAQLIDEHNIIYAPAPVRA